MKDTLIKFTFTYDQCYEFGKLFDKGIKGTKGKRK